MRVFMILCFAMCTIATFLNSATAGGDDLLKSDIIVLGRVEDVFQKSKMTLERGGRIEVVVSEADIAVLCVVKGDKIDRIKIGDLLSPVNPDTFIDKQSLETNKVYMMFLNQKAGQEAVFSPARPTEFAFEIRSEPRDAGQGTLREQISAIASENIKTTDGVVASRWVALLQEITVSDTDISVWREVLKDSRVPIKGVALVWIAAHKPSEPGLRKKVEAFLHETSNVEGAWRIRSQLEKVLPTVPR